MPGERRSPSATRARVGGTTARRIVALLVCMAMVSLSLSGCAAAARVLTAVDAVSRLHDIIASSPPSSAAGPRPSETSKAHATVFGTRGAGLRLERRPGTGRLSVWPDGSDLTIECAAIGPRISGPGGATSTWSRVTTADGNQGFMSDAYLKITEGTGAVPPC